MSAVPIPRRMRQLDRDPRGYPIPWGVWRDSTGKPHFTINDEDKRVLSILDNLCPICGQKLPTRRWFIGGPRAAFDPNGAYADPPVHGDCARYALRACPYLAAPSYGKRIDAGTVKVPVEPTRIVIDPTQIPARPELFVAVLADGQTFTRPRYNVIPKRPYVFVEHWQHGRLLEPDVGARIVQRLLAETTA